MERYRQDGIQDDGEEGVADVNITLYNFIQVEGSFVKQDANMNGGWVSIERSWSLRLGDRI